WQNGLAAPAFTQTGTIQFLVIAGAPEGSSQKRSWVRVISVFGWAGASCRRRRRERTLGSGAGAAHEAFTLISGSPACSTKVGIIISTGRPEAAAMELQKSSAVALLY